jgi:prevent-host-death family protein
MVRTKDVVSITEARARLTELAEEVATAGTEKVLTKNGASFVALIDARKLDYYHALETEHANLVLLDEVERGLADVAAGRTISARELRRRLRR